MVPWHIISIIEESYELIGRHMVKKQQAIRQPKACTVSNLYTRRSDLKLSLHKCSKKSKIKSSTFDILVG